jgi:hypothetical protein
VGTGVGGKVGAPVGFGVVALRFKDTMVLDAVPTAYTEYQSGETSRALGWLSVKASV